MASVSIEAKTEVKSVAIDSGGYSDEEGEYVVSGDNVSSYVVQFRKLHEHLIHVKEEIQDLELKFEAMKKDKEMKMKILQQDLDETRLT